MDSVLTSIDLRAPIGVLVTIALFAIAFRIYLRRVAAADARRAAAVERALDARGPAVEGDA